MEFSYFSKQNQLILSISEIENVKIDQKSAPFSVVTNPDIINKDPRITPENTPFKDNLYLRGRNDANVFYKGYKGASTATYILSAFNPPLGLATALLCSFNPQDKNLNNPYPDLMKDADYMRGYREQAGSIKRQKVWANFGYGVLTLIGFFALILVLLLQR